MTALVRPSDLRLTIIAARTRWAGELRSGLPLLRWPSGTLCEPVILYLGYSMEMDRVRRGSIKQEAYVLREWFAYLLTRGKRWEDADDALLKEWRASFARALRNGELQERRVERKLQVVFEFYRLVTRAMPFDEGGRLRRPFVGECDPVAGLVFPIGSKRVISPHPNAGVMWVYGKVCDRGLRRPTPNDAQVAAVISNLRSKPERVPSRREGERARREDLILADRNWLMARCASEAALRADEIARLNLPALRAALARQHLDTVAPPTPGKRRPRPSLDGLGPEERLVVIDGLDGLARDYRRTVMVAVRGKGGRGRMVPFPMPLLRDLLEVGVWTVRERQVAYWAEGDPRFRPTDYVFLSLKGRGRLTAGAVSDILKGAFRDVGVPGSGHRLRAYCAMMMAADLLEEAFLSNNCRLDSTILNGVYDQLAAALEHAHAGTTLKHYVDATQLMVQSASGRKRLGALARLWAAVLANRDLLSDPKTRLLTQIVERLAESDEGSMFQQILQMALEDVRLGGSRPTEGGRNPGGSGRPNLRIVAPSPVAASAHALDCAALSGV